jgi:hypothetical protein
MLSKPVLILVFPGIKRLDVSHVLLHIQVQLFRELTGRSATSSRARHKCHACRRNGAQATRLASYTEFIDRYLTVTSRAAKAEMGRSEIGESPFQHLELIWMPDVSTGPKKQAAQGWRNVSFAAQCRKTFVLCSVV